MTSQSKTTDLTRGEIVANRIRHLFCMMLDARNPDFHKGTANYDPQAEIENDLQDIAAAIDEQD